MVLTPGQGDEAFVEVRRAQWRAPVGVSVQVPLLRRANAQLVAGLDSLHLGEHFFHALPPVARRRRPEQFQQGAPKLHEEDFVVGRSVGVRDALAGDRRHGLDPSVREPRLRVRLRDEDDVVVVE